MSLKKTMTESEFRSFIYHKVIGLEIMLQTMEFQINLIGSFIIKQSNPETTDIQSIMDSINGMVQSKKREIIDLSLENFDLGLDFEDEPQSS